MDFDLILKIVLAIIGLIAPASIFINIKISKSKKTDNKKNNRIGKQVIIGDGNMQAGRDINKEKD